MHSNPEPRPEPRIRASLLLGALGDALGAPVEFDSLAEIRARFGPDGLRAPAPAYGRHGAVTDDTQMTLFVAEGLVIAGEAGALGRPGELVRIQHRAHLRWLHTQGVASAHPSLPGAQEEGWLRHVPALRARRAPGNTCLAGLRAARMGTPEQPLNTSKGCGGVMRVAPLGLAPAAPAPLELARRSAALTHGHPTGHPTGQLAAGLLAAIVRDLVRGGELPTALREGLDELRHHPGHEETTAAARRALALAERGGPATPERLETLGGGWIAEEALAIALYSALTAPDPKSALLLAVNHSGDSDSTGAITGHLVGAMDPDALAAVPAEWLEELELREVIEEMAGRLAALYSSPPPP